MPKTKRKKLTQSDIDNVMADCDALSRRKLSAQETEFALIDFDLRHRDLYNKIAMMSLPLEASLTLLDALEAVKLVTPLTQKAVEDSKFEFDQVEKAILHATKALTGAEARKPMDEARAAKFLTRYRTKLAGNEAAAKEATHKRAFIEFFDLAAQMNNLARALNIRFASLDAATGEVSITYKAGERHDPATTLVLDSPEVAPTPEAAMAMANLLKDPNVKTYAARPAR